MQKLINIINNFRGKKIGVIGDLMLDQFIFGQVHRISPEAPVPVVLFEKETYVLGGAANTAHNIASLGGDVFLVGAIGQDDAGNEFLRQVKKNAMSDKGIFTVPRYFTTQKSRVIARGQQVVRVDREQAESLGKKIEDTVMRFISKHMAGWDGVIVSDYGKGFITEKIAKEIIRLARVHKKPVVGDVKITRHARYFDGIDVLKPNAAEAFAISQCHDITEAGKKIQKELHCDVLVTQGADGMTLFERKKVTHVPALAKEVVDIVGAGDTVAAAVCLALSVGASLEESMIIANHAAGIVVSKAGTATVDFKELKKGLLGHE